MMCPADDLKFDFSNEQLDQIKRLQMVSILAAKNTADLTMGRASARNNAITIADQIAIFLELLRARDGYSIRAYFSQNPILAAEVRDICHASARMMEIALKNRFKWVSAPTPQDIGLLAVLHFGLNIMRRFFENPLSDEVLPDPKWVSDLFDMASEIRQATYSV